MSKLRGFRGVLVVAIVAIVVGAATAAVLILTYRGAPAAKQADFVKRDGDHFTLDGKPFAVAGANNYRPMFLDPDLVDQIMQSAQDNHFGVLRVWGFNDIGLADGSRSVDSYNTTTYFHYWDGAKPAFNDHGPKSLDQLDYVIASAKKHNIRLVLPFTNNWGSFGGMDQYVRWAKATYHSDFYTDATMRQWYKDWMSHLLARTNTYTGVKYADEPTIAIFELANEPRCMASGTYPAGPSCTTGTITAWAKEMSAYFKSLDHNHLLGLGDEGFLCDRSQKFWTYDCSQGVDGAAIAALSDIDMVGMHLYPSIWGTDPAWGTDYIQRHVALATTVGKPLFIGEYGWQGEPARNVVFNQWLAAFSSGGGDIALYWQMQPKTELSVPQDSDGFTAYCPSAVCTQVSYRSQAMLSGRHDFPPVSEVDFYSAKSGQTLPLDPLANDVSLFSSIDPATLDLDPATPGIQSTRTVDGGTFTVAAGKATFTASAGFTGKVTVDYCVSDTEHRLGSTSSIIIQVSAN